MHKPELTKNPTEILIGIWFSETFSIIYRNTSVCIWSDEYSVGGLGLPIAYLKVQIITRETDKHLFTKKWLKTKQSCGRWLAHFRGNTMCDCNLESPAWDWMCADVCKAAGGRDSDKIALSPTSLVAGSMCVVFSRTSATTSGCKAF